MSIYHTVGGADSVAAAVDDFYSRVLADEELAGYFAETDLQRLKAHQRAFIAAAIGGPEIYQGRSMGEAHAGLDITPAHFDRVVGHLVDTLAALDVPEPVIWEIGVKLAPLKDEITTGATPATATTSKKSRWRWLGKEKLAS